MSQREPAVLSAAELGATFAKPIEPARFLAEVSAPRHKAVVLMPTYNERDNLLRIASAIIATADVDLMIIDDNSADGTGHIADELARETVHVSVLHRPNKLGQGRAYVDGMKRALQLGYDHIITMDADFSHPPEKLPEMLAKAKSHDVVIASRNVEGSGSENRTLMRQLISKTGGLYARTMLGLDVQDMTSGFKCFHRQVLEAIDVGSIASNGYAFHIEVIYRAAAAGYSLVEMPYVFVDRTAGKSKMSSSIVWEALMLCPKLRFKRD